MANDREIVIRIREDGSAEVVDAIKSAGKAAGDMGKDADKASVTGKAAFWGLGQAAEELGAKIGITGQANRRLGNTVEDLVSRLPGLATGLGIVTLAVGAGVAAYQHFAEANAKAREEMYKAGAAALEHERGLRSVLGTTRELEQANWEYQRTLLAIDRINLGRSLREMKKELEELKKQTVDTAAGTAYLGMATEEARYKYELKKIRVQELTASVKLYEKELEQVAKLENLPTSPQQKALEQQIATDNKIANLNREWEEEKRINDARFAYDQAAYETSEKARQQDLANEQAYRLGMINLQMTYYQTYLNLASQAIAGYIAVTGKNNVALFAIQKALAIAQIWVDTQRAAMSAAASVAGIPIVGPALAAAAYGQMQALGYASMGIAAAAAIGQVATGSWKGAGGGGGGATGSYPASPGTGQPSTQSDNRQINVYINNPLVDDNWQLIAERYIVPALNANGDRGVQLNTQVVRS